MRRNNGILDLQLNGCSDLEVLLCMQPASAQNIIDPLLDLSCKVYMAESVDDAVSKLQFHSFDVVVVQEGYSTEIIKVMANTPMSVRRNIFFVLVGENVETKNLMQSFALSTNLVVNREDLHIFHKILLESTRENNFFFRPMAIALQQLGEKSLGH